MNSSGYYILTYEDRINEDLWAIESYDMGEFNLMSLWVGSLVDSIPTSVQLRLTLGDPSDLVANPIEWLIVSMRMKDILATFHQEVQFLPITLRAKDGTEVADYWVANPLTVVDAMMEGPVPISRLRIDPGKIPADAHLFRVKGIYFSFVSHALRLALQEAKLVGLDFFSVMGNKPSKKESRRK